MSALLQARPSVAGHLTQTQLTENTNRDRLHSQEGAGGTLRSSLTTWWLLHFTADPGRTAAVKEGNGQKSRKEGSRRGEVLGPEMTQCSEKSVPQESRLYLKLCLASLK